MSAIFALWPVPWHRNPSEFDVAGYMRGSILFRETSRNHQQKTSSNCILVRLYDKTSVRRKNQLTVCIDHYLLRL